MSETSGQKEEDVLNEDISQKNEDISQKEEDISQVQDIDIPQKDSQVQDIDIPQKDDDEDDYEKSNYDILNISQQIYTYQQKILYKDLDKKKEKLSIKIEILRFKYAEYKKLSDYFNLLIIILSSSITLLQSVNAELKINNYIFTLAPIFISTIIALLAAVIRFKKWGDKMEIISKCISNSILTLKDIKSLKNDIKLSSCKQDMDDILDKYKNDLKYSINQTETDIITNLKFIDFVKHMKKFQQYSLRFKDSDGYFQYKQKKIDHKIDIIEELILENKEYVQDSYKITTWYCDLYHRLCCCFKKKLLK